METEITAKDIISGKVALNLPVLPVSKELISVELAEYYMIEFAKYHVEKALKEAAEKAEAIEGWNTGYSGSAALVDKQSILDAYDLDNIK